jgi:hypothetical protein
VIGGALLGLPAVILVCVLFGLGLDAGAPTAVALVSALALTLLPVAGLGAWLERIGSGETARASARIFAVWIWTGTVLLAVPYFAPGLRSTAARDGADALFARHLGPLRDPVCDAVGGLAGLLGSDGEPPANVPLFAAAPREPATEPEPPVESETAEPPAPLQRPPAREPALPVPAPEDEAPVVLAYRGDGRELDVEVALDGPRLGERFRMIFDTGASFTTVTPEALEEIDVRIPADAPRVTLHTAGGQIEAPLVLLDAVWMGDHPIEWVTVAACPSCTAPGRAGLLGLNVSSQFRVEIDHDRKRIHLDPSPGDRRHDIRPWLELGARGVQHGLERLELDVTVRNRAPRAIESATVEIDCGASGYAVEVGAIPARGERTTGLTLPGDVRCEAFRLELLSARWVLDRF